MQYAILTDFRNYIHYKPTKLVQQLINRFIIILLLYRCAKRYGINFLEVGTKVGIKVDINVSLNRIKSRHTEVGTK